MNKEVIIKVSRQLKGFIWHNRDVYFVEPKTVWFRNALEDNSQHKWLDYEIDSGLNEITPDVVSSIIDDVNITAYVDSYSVLPIFQFGVDDIMVEVEKWTKNVSMSGIKYYQNIFDLIKEGKDRTDRIESAEPNDKWKIRREAVTPAAVTFDASNLVVGYYNPDYGNRVAKVNEALGIPTTPVVPAYCDEMADKSLKIAEEKGIRYANLSGRTETLEEVGQFSDAVPEDIFGVHIPVPVKEGFKPVIFSKTDTKAKEVEKSQELPRGSSSAGMNW